MATTAQTETATEADVLRSINPATQTLIAEYPVHTAAEVERSLERAAATAGRWRATSLDDRAELLRSVARLLRETPTTSGPAQDSAALMTLEMGKPIGQAQAEIEKCAWVCDYYAEQGAAFLAPERIETDASESGVRFDPLGVVLAVMPWNFPFWQVFRFAAPALMAGNVGLLKHASNVPGCAARIEELFRQAGAPEGAFQTLMIGSDRVEAVVRDERVAAVTLTGSEPAGRAVASVAASEVKKSVLELGGSDPFVVLADADVEAAADAAVTARVQNNGQSCIAAKRFIVEEELYPAFVERLDARFQRLRVGDPMDPETDVGPLARAEFVDDLDEIVTRSVAAGAQVIHGGRRPDRLGFFYEPTLLAECDATMACFQEETFGPVAAVARVADADEAIRLANETSFGLGASLWTAPDRGSVLIDRIAAGHVAVNGIVKSDPRLPFGGIKRSGFGRELSRYGMLEFMNLKSYWIA
jgi:succinate-semialdehyde dehydrogenase/glutarate-semialdehyde dehydrogenase